MERTKNEMTYKEKIEIIKRMAMRHPKLSDREVGVMLDAAFNEDSNVSQIISDAVWKHTI